MEQNKAYKITTWVLALIVSLLTISMVSLCMRRPKAPPQPPRQGENPPVIARVAIVIDDMGYSLNNLEMISNIKYPLTFSILPSVTYSRPVAQELDNRGFEIILHLPMEPYEKTSLEENTVLTSMNPDQVRQVVNNDLDSIPHLKGISNHMGSRATEDTRTMGIIFSELKKRRLYFLDSFVTGKSVAAFLAGKMHIKFTRRDVFLDNSADPRYIKQQLNLLMKKARQKGQAVGIGHDRKHTLEVLNEMMPEFAQQGYKFVFVSELAR
jgi:polysaccharide deacetylase 2 family uncharacterized protein YibQ